MTVNRLNMLHDAPNILQKLRMNKVVAVIVGELGRVIFVGIFFKDCVA
jgi:hypothetical protein